MILKDPRGKTAAAGASPSLDELFRRAAVRAPDAIALIDPPNRANFTDGAPRSLTYAQADQAVSSLAARLRRAGLPIDSIVGLQTANTVDGVLTLLAVLRAGLIAMPMPLLWRRAEMVAALTRVAAPALIVSGRIGSIDHYDLAVQAAVEVFSVRHIFGFGADPPDGVLALDDTAAARDSFTPVDRERARPPGPGVHLAVVTWDVSEAGPVPVARSHAELIAGGLAVQLESRIKQHACIHATLALSSFGALATTLLPWLLVGGTLVLHHPFDLDTFAEQSATCGCDTVVVPGPLAPQLAQAGHFSAPAAPKRVLAVWRAPERLGRALGWHEAAVDLIDIQVFGETGLIPAARAADGRPAAIRVGPIRVPRSAREPTVIGEAAATTGGTLALRGPMVPGYAFPRWAERGAQPYFNIAPNGFADTGYPCRIDDDATIAVTAPPPGLVGVGGYRFVVRPLQAQVRRLASSAALTVLPDALAGQRLAGTGRDRAAVRESLTRLGANALVVGAFREPRRPPLTSR